jgi:hypothetical protein
VAPPAGVERALAAANQVVFQTSTPILLLCPPHQLLKLPLGLCLRPLLLLSLPLRFCFGLPLCFLLGLPRLSMGVGWLSTYHGRPVLLGSSLRHLEHTWEGKVQCSGPHKSVFTSRINVRVSPQKEETEVEVAEEREGQVCWVVHG